MSYTFTEGKYRAFVRTDFLKAGSSLSTIHKDGRSYEFVYDAPAPPVEYFVFRTNQNVMLDPDTLEVPNSRLVNSGTYKGLNYAIYANGLCIVSGTQDTAMTSEDESPWYDNAEYIYTKCDIIGGYVFKNTSVRELEVGSLGFVANTNENPDALFKGSAYEYINIVEFDPSNTNTLRMLFNSVDTVEIDGLAELGTKITHVSNMMHMLSGLHRSGGNRNIFLSVGTNNIDEYSAGAFGLTGENTELVLHVSKGVPSICAAHTQNDHPLKRLTFSCDSFETTYAVSPFRSSGAKSIRVLKLNTSGQTIFSDLFYNCKYVEDIQIYSISGFTTAAATACYGMFENCTNLKRITDENGHNYELDTTNIRYANDMFSGCENLEELPFARDNDGINFPSLYGGPNMFYKCFKQTENVWPYLEIKLSSSVMGSFNNFCEESGFKGVVVRFNQNRLSSFPTFDQGCKNSQVELVTIEINSSSANTGYSVNAKYFRELCEGCTKLIYFQYLGASNLAVYIAGDVSKMFYGCSNLTDVELAYLRLAGTVDTTDMLTGCSRLDEFVTPGGSESFSITLPKTMYVGGTAYTVATLKNTKYDTTP